MKFFWEKTIERLAGWQPVRRLASAVALDRAGRHLVELDHSDPARCQLRHMIGLVHRARNTSFGRSHDFARIRTYDDFKRLVPLSTAADYTRLHTTGEDAGRSANWPGPVLSWLPPQSSRFPVPVSRELLATSNQTTATALAHIMAARPRERLLNGRTVFLNDDSTRLLQAALGHRHRAFRPYAQGMADATPAALVAAHLTCLVGEASSILQVLKEARRLTARESLRAIWPDLCAMVCIRSGAAFDSSHLRLAVADPSIVILEGWCDNASPVAIEDPRHDALRLLTDHGVFWEFIPIESLTSEPERLSVGSIEIGGRYALAVSSPAGVWSCLLREQIVIESRTPVLIRVLESPVLTAPRQKQSQPARASARRPLALLKTES
jgi:GH3 auxin-responsive promoter